MTDETLRTFLHESTIAALSRRYGGQEITIPSETRGRAWTRLVADVGEDHARVCVRWLAGSRVYVPCTHGKNELREQVRALRASGMSAEKISREFVYVSRLSARQIYRICGEKR